MTEEGAGRGRARPGPRLAGRSEVGFALGPMSLEASMQRHQTPFPSKVTRLLFPHIFTNTGYDLSF